MIKKMDDWILEKMQRGYYWLLDHTGDVGNNLAAALWVYAMCLQIRRREPPEVWAEARQGAR